MFDDTVKAQLEQALTGMRQNLEAGVADLKSDPKMALIIESHRKLNDLESVLDKPKTSLAELFGLEVSEKSEAKFAPARIDEYYSLQPLEAAKRYLKKKGSAATLDEIVAAIKAGGCKVNSAANLRKTLTRSTWQVAKVGNDIFGLVEFYGGRKRAAKKDKGTGSDTENGDDSEVNEEDEGGEAEGAEPEADSPVA
jgi:hypothetical protein